MFNNKVELFLDNYSNIYYPGQTISGRVECFFTTDYFGSVKITYTGIAETKWTSEEMYYDDFHKEERVREVEYSDKDIYFYTQQVLIEGGNNFRPAPGKHTVPFTFLLPQNIPSSFEGVYGNIEYKILVTMDNPSIVDHECEKIINIIAPLDLNLFPNLRLGEPLERSLDTTPCSFWCQNSGPITFTMSLPTTGFVPGQEVNISACVENLSNVTVEDVEFGIIGKVEYTTPEEKNHEELIVVGCPSQGAIGAHGEKTWTATLTIPTNRPIPNLKLCRIININYYLRAKVVLPFPHVDLFDEVEVMIGTVPLLGVHSNYRVYPIAQNDSYAPTAPLIEDASAQTNLNNPANGYRFSRPPSDVPPYPDGEMSSAPPTYEEAQLLDQKAEKSE